ncbi:MAG TPA: ATP-dependent DNA ligase [Acidimicrobiia bacterium]|nr:ATP-dependent DNA ligase [Acidimicrobiia bacterium]
MLLARLVETSATVRATRSRLAKVEALAGLLGGLQGIERAIGARYLAGAPRQDRLGVGYRTLAAVSVDPAPEATLTLTGVDEALEAIAAEGGPGSQARRHDRLEGLLGSATAAEQQFLRALIVREVRQGALEGVLVEAVSRAIEADPDEVRRAVMVTGDLAGVAEAALGEGREVLSRFRMRLRRPIQPMLASTAEDVDGAIERLGTPARVEAKLDGARIQVHRDGGEVSVFTRNLRDVTARVPEIVEIVLGLAASTVILDGEAIVLDTDGRPRPFQETMGRFGRSTGPIEDLSAFFFDVLHADGTDLVSEPLERRLEVLETLPEGLRIPGRTVDGVAAAADFLDEVLARGHEGVMVKDLASPYAAGRRGSAWLKVKPAHTLDLVVLAVEWGSGRRRGLLSNLHLGARDPDGGFVMLGKTFKGLTDEMLVWQTDRFLGLETGRSGPVVHVRPEQVVEIAFDGIQASSRYSGGMALRFARVKGYRTDKGAEEADTIDTVRSIFEGSRG